MNNEGADLFYFEFSGFVTGLPELMYGTYSMFCSKTTKVDLQFER